VGYAARLALRDAAGLAWCGEHRAESVELAGLLASLPALDSAVLTDEVGAAAAWAHVLPTGVELVTVLRPAVVHLRLSSGPIREVVVKLVRPSLDRGPIGWLRRFERSRAQRAHLAAHRLQAVGVMTPRPLGYLERRRAPRQHPSFCVYEHLAGHTLLEVAATRVGPEQRMARWDLLRQVAELYARLHQHGIFHADLHAGNLLVTEHGLAPIDLVSLRRFSFRERAALKNLARLNRDFLDRGALSTADRFRFLLAYLRHQSSARAQARDLFRAVHQETLAKLERYGGAFSSSPTSAYDALDVPTVPVPALVRPDDAPDPGGRGVP
jgi:tRNA A-37 threonylcarbamoyl transferase component Bud32